MDDTAWDVRELDVAACEEDKLSQVLNAAACEIECCGIGPITQKKNKEFDFVYTSNANLVYVDLN